MLQLAQKYAKSLGTKVINHRIDGEQIIFILESGQKLTKSEDELKKAIQKATPPAETAEEPKAEKPKTKTKE